jgi:hypothetical protein
MYCVYKYLICTSERTESIHDVTSIGSLKTKINLHYTLKSNLHFTEERKHQQHSFISTSKTTIILSYIKRSG